MQVFVLYLLSNIVVAGVGGTCGGGVGGCNAGGASSCGGCG